MAPPQIQVLVVDDDQVDRMAVRRALKAHPDVVLEDARDVEEAIALLNERSFDLLLIDYFLPPQNGDALLAHLRAEGLDTPAVLLSGQGNEALVAELMRAGAADYFSKSKLDGEQLYGVIRRVHADAQLKHAAKEHALERSELRDRLLGIVSHDLKNPLNALIQATALLDRTRLDDHQRRLLGHVRSSSDRMTNIVVQLLDVTRMELGTGLPLQLACADVLEICERAAVELRLVHHQQTILVQGEHAFVEGDAQRLTQVASNLLANALQHGRPSEPVVVTVRSAGKSVELSVRNRGEPIPADTLKVLFAPYFRAHAEPHGAGLGLGLFIAHEIVRAHHGTIHASSSAESGTEFVVQLPAATLAPGRIRAPSRPLPPLPLQGDGA